MKNYFYLLICTGTFLACCKSPSHEIPFRSVKNETAMLMIKKYLKPDSTADTSFREVPKRLDLGAETVKTFTAKNKDGKVDSVRFILAAYLETRQPYEKNTILLRIKRSNNQYYFYDLRDSWDPKLQVVINAKPGPVCPLPQDCWDNWEK